MKYFFKEALKSMKRNGLMTLASISTVALSLFMLGVFLCGVINLNNMASSLENQVQLTLAKFRQESIVTLFNSL